MAWTLPNFIGNENQASIDSLLTVNEKNSEEFILVPCINCVYEKTCSIESQDGNPHNCELILDWVSGKNTTKENEKTDNDDYFDIISAVEYFFGKSARFNFTGILEKNKNLNSPNKFVIRDKESKTIPVVFEYYDQMNMEIDKKIKLKNVRLSGSGSTLRLFANRNSIISN